MTNNEACYNILLKNGDFLTYCNVTNLWETTVTKTDGYAAGTCIFLIALVVIGFGISRLKGLFKKLCCVCQRNGGCCTRSPLVITLILGTVWKFADIIIDSFTWYRLGSGGLVDRVIYRNPHVLNSIIVFTVLGIFGLLFRYRLVYLKADEIESNDDVQALKLSMALIAFCVEDAAQMFVEYFWIQKYVTIEIPKYLVVKDTIIAILALFALVTSALGLRKHTSTRSDLIFFAFGVIVNAVEYLRVGAVLKQYKNGTFHQDCISVDEGRIWQTPFAGNCMSTTDKWILGLTFAPFASIPFLVVAFKSDFDNVFAKFSSTEALSDTENQNSNNV